MIKHLILFLFLSIAIPVFASGNEPHGYTEKAIYGSDNRQELAQANLIWQKVGQSVAAVFPYKSLYLTTSENHYQLPDKIAGEQWNWCPNEPFYDQPVGAICSSFVVGERLIATAGHCVQPREELGNGISCKDAAFVFGHQLSADGSITSQVSVNDVFFCQKILAGKISLDGEDWRLIKTDRKINRPALKLSSTGLLNQSSSIAAIGYPMGLPAKVADNAQVTKRISDQIYRTNLDVFQGNSGSPVFSVDHESGNEIKVAGMLIRGELKEFTRSSQCVSSRKCTLESCRGEDVLELGKLKAAIKSTFVTQ